MQLARDGTIILDLDEVAETNHTIVWCEHCHLASSVTEELVTLQFGSLKPVVLLLMVPATLMEVRPVPDIANEGDKGWALGTRRRPKR